MAEKGTDVIDSTREHSYMFRPSVAFVLGCTVLMYVA
jgi:hypothetical protein